MLRCAAPRATVLHETGRAAWHHRRHARVRGSSRRGERGVPKSRHPPTTRDFGLELSVRSVAYEMGAWTRVAWQEPGAKVEIHRLAEGTPTIRQPGDQTDTP